MLAGPAAPTRPGSCTSRVLVPRGSAPAVLRAAARADRRAPAPRRADAPGTSSGGLMSELVVDSGDTVWVLVSAALVLFMMPGLALFYAGLVRRGNVLAIMQQNLVPIA